MQGSCQSEGRRFEDEREMEVGLNINLCNQIHWTSRIIKDDRYAASLLHELRKLCELLSVALVMQSHS